MRRIGAVLVALLAAGVITACSESGRRTSDPKRATGCPRANFKWPSRTPPEFFPRSRAGLWVLRGRAERCVYLVAGDEVHAVWSGRPGDRVRGVTWAPDGQRFAVTTESRRGGWHVVLVRRDGEVLRRLAATGAAFLGDGRLAVSREAGIELLVDSQARRLASREELERVAGFRARRLLPLSPDPQGFALGHGRDRVAMTLWSGDGTWRTVWKSALLVVSAGGKVTRASPAYRASGIDGVVLGWAWSPDGQELFVTAEVPGPQKRRERGSHDHCVDVWSPDRGRRRAFCESQLPAVHQSHFARLVWSTAGTKGLLDTGTVLTRAGRVVSHIPVAGWTFDVQWEPADDE